MRSGCFPFFLIHKLVENYMGQTSLFWSDLDLRFVSFYQFNYIAGKMYAKWQQKHCTKPCSANSHDIMVISIQFTNISVWYTPFTIWLNYRLFKPKCHLQAYYVKCRQAKWWRERTLLYFHFLVIMRHYESVLCSSSLHLFLQKHRKKLILWNIITI